MTTINWYAKLFCFKNGIIFPMDDSERRKADIQREIDMVANMSRSLGQENFGNFASTSQNSNVPEQFAQAATNVLDQFKGHTSGIQEALQNLVGIEYKTKIEATYILTYGTAIALMKQLQREGLSEEERARIRQEAEDALGRTILLRDEVSIVQAGPLRRLFSKQPDGETIDHATRLKDQFEDRLLNPQVRARIILVGTPRRI